jgi:hypothetical protein
MNIELTSDQKIKVMNSSMVFKVMKQILMRENEIERDLSLANNISGWKLT